MTEVSCLVARKATTTALHDNERVWEHDPKAVVDFHFVVARHGNRVGCLRIDSRVSVCLYELLDPTETQLSVDLHACEFFDADECATLVFVVRGDLELVLVVIGRVRPTLQCELYVGCARQVGSYSTIDSD